MEECSGKEEKMWREEVEQKKNRPVYVKYTDDDGDDDCIEQINICVSDVLAFFQYDRTFFFFFWQRFNYYERLFAHFPIPYLIFARFKYRLCDTLISIFHLQ